LTVNAGAVPRFHETALKIHHPGHNRDEAAADGAKMRELADVAGSALKW
jgi:hypothetical protein